MHMLKYKYMQRSKKPQYLRKGLLFFLSFAFVVSTFSALTGSVSAKKVFDMTPQEEAASFTYYTALRKCVIDAMNSQINTVVGESGAADPTKVEWFNTGFAGGTNTTFTVFNGSSSSQKDCKDIVKPALELWGWSGAYTEFLKDMGYKFSANTDPPRWERANDSSESRLMAFESSVQKKAYNSTFITEAPSLSDAGRYALFASFTSKCALTTLGAYPSGVKDPTIRGYVDNNTIKDDIQYTKKPLIGDDGRVSTYAISYKTNIALMEVYGHGGTPDGSRVGCATIVDTLSSTAPGMATYNAVKACEKIGVTDKDQPGSTAACAYGYANTDIAQCQSKYSGNTVLRKACFIGQGNEAAEACTLKAYTGKDLQACINGSKNKNPDYCDTAYAGVYSAGKFTAQESEKAACKFGQGLEIIDSPTVIDDGLGGSDCTANPSGEGCSEASTCTIEGIGWLICPVVNFMSGIVDGAYAFVSSLLVVQPLLTTNTSGENMYKVWTVMRNLANVAFVIAFMIIIFSQLSSVGVSNYGVKKLLPRLIIAAILVNISFWVCAIAVDLSNIIGGSIRSVFDAVGATIPTLPNSGADADIGTTWTGIAGTVLAATAVVGTVAYVGISAFIPAILAALLAIVAVFLVLTLRQALIILLIVVSPLAFVAYLLPNTEELFTKWRKLFITLLLMYPIIAGIFGASALASQVIASGSTGANNAVVIQIMAALVSILPLALTPVVMKGAGGLLNRFGGVINNPNKGPVDKLRKSGEAYHKDRQNIRNARALSSNSKFGRSAFVKWGARRNAIKAGRESEMNRANTTYIAGQSENNAAFRNKVAGGTSFTQAAEGGDQRALANAINTNLKLEADEVSAAKAVIENANLSGDERQKLAMTGKYEKMDASGKIIATYSGKTMQKAALQEQLRTGSMAQIHEIAENSGSARLKEFSQTISTGIASNGVASKNPALGGKTLDAIAQGRVTNSTDLDNVILGAIKEGKYTAESMATMHDDSRQRAIDLAIAARAAGDSSYYDALKDAKAKLLASSELSAKVGGNTRALSDFGRIT